MNLLHLLPVALSFLPLSAHFYRAGQWPLVALCLAAPLLLLLRKSWAPRLFQALLVLGALEWLRTLYAFATMRIAFEQPWTRLAPRRPRAACSAAASGRGAGEARERRGVWRVGMWTRRPGGSGIFPQRLCYPKACSFVVSTDRSSLFPRGLRRAERTTVGGKHGHQSRSRQPGTEE